MKGTMLLGIGLIVFGVISLAYQGFSYTTRERVAEIGPIKVDADKEKTVALPPILGGLALAGGIALVLASSKRG
jgi:hypothetical protein